MLHLSCNYLDMLISEKDQQRGRQPDLASQFQTDRKINRAEDPCVVLWNVDH